ncbi:MAG TPA: adenylate/guanylate cyclase domain-containing protein, partial [Puia sp.]|nr:adenylate/guanylate cyclase domain-containing protein [Puia sp.]
MSQQRHLAAILFTDIVGYTALMQEDEHKAVALIKHYSSSLDKNVISHGGRVLNYYGDGSLCTFPSATEAVICALELQRDLQSDPFVPLRIGLHVGEVFFEEGQALGDGVNIASRIQSLGQANTILFSKEIHDKIKNQPEFKSVFLGKFDFKNIDDSVDVYALSNEGLHVPRKEQMSGKLKRDGSKNPNAVRKIILGTASLLVLAGLSVFAYLKYDSVKEQKVKNSIAVMPFRNNSSDISQQYFADGMMDEVLHHLYKIGGLNVISKTSSKAYKDSKKTAKEIVSELGVGNLLEGSVSKDGDSIRIFVDLINGKTDEHLWAETYIRKIKDVFTIQSDIAQRIAAALKLKIDAETKERIEYVPTENTSAYTTYLKSTEKYAHNDTIAWRKLLEETIQSDSNFAPAYADLGLYLLLMGIYDGKLNAKQVTANALPLLRNAIRLDSNLASARNYMAQVHTWYDWDFKAANKEWIKFHQLNPSGAVWADNYNDFLNSSGRFQEALDFCQKNRAIDKSNSGYWQALAITYYYMNNPEKSLMILDTASQYFKMSDNPNLYWTRALSLILLGKYQQAMDNLNKYFESDHDLIKVPRWLSLLSITY